MQKLLPTSFNSGFTCSGPQLRCKPSILCRTSQAFLCILSNTYYVSREPSELVHGIYLALNFSPALHPEYHYMGHSPQLGFLSCQSRALLQEVGENGLAFPSI